MTEHPGTTEPGADDSSATAAGSDTEQDDLRDVRAEAPAEQSAPSDAREPQESGEPDALGHVEEQTLLPEEQSTVSHPGEALEELLPALEVTGHDGVDDALATLDEMAGKSVHDHVEVFDAVHDELRRTLDQAADQ